MHPPRELALVGRCRVAGLVDVAGEHDQVDRGRDGAVDRLIERVEKIVQALVQPRFGVDPPVVLHADVGIGEVRDAQRRLSHRRRRSPRSDAHGTA